MAAGAVTAVIDWQRWLPAPAKINLFLHVIGQRQDGYHLLQTAFRFLDHGDRLKFSPRADGCVRRLNDVPGVAEDDDLVVRAARLLQQAAGCTLGADIELDKHLPMGGGLGGGSSDAATVLLALNALWGLNLPRPHLQALGLQLGADVPVFVSGRSAFAEGVGERLQPLVLPPAAYVVIAPGVSVPTPRIFADPELTRNTEPCTIADFAAAAGAVAGNAAGTGGIADEDAGRVAGKCESLHAKPERLFGRNDLEAVAVRHYPEVKQAIDMLSALAGPENVRMSGSGACVFAQCPDSAAAEGLMKVSSAQWPAGWQGFVARGLDEHPLFRMSA